MFFLKKKDKNLKKEDNKADNAHMSSDYKYLAMHDDLTDLYNDRAFREKKEQPAEGLAVISIRLNTLKDVKENKEQGYADLMVKKLALSIKDLFPDKGYRLGEEKFIVVDSFSKEDAQEKKNQIKGKMDYYTQSSLEHLNFSVSVGISFGRENEKLGDVLARSQADLKKDYNNFLNPDITENMDAEKNLGDYDAKLTKQQQELKLQVSQRHEEVLESSVQRIISMMQEKDDDIEAILLADKNFNHLFIFLDTKKFYDLVRSAGMAIDFSYLYVLYDGGPQYFGNDEYTSDITHLFEDIGSALLERRIRTKEDLAKIKGIEIFSEIHQDFLED